MSQRGSAEPRLLVLPARSRRSCLRAPLTFAGRSRSVFSSRMFGVWACLLPEDRDELRAPRICSNHAFLKYVAYFFFVVVNLLQPYKPVITAQLC